MFSWTNARYNLKRFCLQFFLLFFIGSASCMLADDSSQEQSSDRDTKNKTHARIKENVSRLASFVEIYKKEMSLRGNDDSENNKRKIYHIPISCDRINQLNNIISDFQEHMERLRDLAEDYDKQSTDKSLLDNEVYQPSNVTCSVLALSGGAAAAAGFTTVGAGGATGAGVAAGVTLTAGPGMAAAGAAGTLGAVTTTGAGATAGVGAGTGIGAVVTATLATVTWPVLVAGGIVIVAGSLTAYYIMDSTDSNIAAEKAVQLQVEIEKENAKIADERQAEIEQKNAEKIRIAEEESLRDAMTKEQEAKFEQTVVIEDVSETEDSEEYYDEYSFENDEEYETIDDASVDALFSYIGPGLTWILGGAGGATVGQLVGPVVGAIYIGMTIVKNLEKDKNNGGGGDDDDDEKKKKKKEETEKEKEEKARELLENAGYVVGLGATVCSGGGSNGKPETIIVSDNNGNKIEFEFTDGNPQPRIINETVAHPGSYPDLLKNVQAKHQGTESARQQDKATKNMEAERKRAWDKYNKEQAEKEKNANKVKNTHKSEARTPA